MHAEVSGSVLLAQRHRDLEYHTFCDKHRSAALQEASWAPRKRPCLPETTDSLQVRPKFSERRMDVMFDEIKHTVQHNDASNECFSQASR